MKKQYVAAVRKAKAAAASASKALKPAESPATTGTKRKADAGANSTTISLKIGDVSLEVGIPTAAAAGNKKQKKEPAESKKKATPAAKTKGTADSKAKTTAAPKPKATPKAKAVVKEPSSKAKTTEKPAKTKPAATQPGPVAASSSSPMQRAGRPIQTARRGKPFSLSPATRNVPRGSAHRFQHPSSLSDSDMDDDAPPPYESIDFDHSPPSPSENSDSDIVQISGIYNVLSPQLSKYHTLALQIDHYTDELWGSFQLGAHSGVIRMTSIEGITEGRPVSFGWRSRNDNTGQLKFGRACNGSMEFDGHEGVHGHFYGFLYGDDLEFVGTLEDDTPGMVDLDDLREQWDSFPRIAYD